MKKKRKKTPEERAAELAYREDLDRRLQRKSSTCERSARREARSSKAISTAAFDK